MSNIHIKIFINEKIVLSLVFILIHIYIHIRVYITQGNYTILVLALYGHYKI